MRLSLLVVPCASLLGVAAAGGLDDDAYVDYSFSCPLQTDPTVAACGQVCVADSASCPLELQCDAGGLCVDGSCAASCPPDAENPCEEYDGLGTACYMDGYAASAADCSAAFSAQYAAMDEAGADDDDYYGDIVPPDYPGFVAFYCWMGFITFAAFMFFAYNNKISPIGEVKDFMPEVASQMYKDKVADNIHCTQTGYCNHLLGTALYSLVVLTMLGLQVVILLLTIAYYFILNRADIKEDTPDLSLAWSPFEDAPQSLEAFVIAWSIAFVWVLLFKRPQSIFAAFLRRSCLGDATHVAVFIPLARGVEVLNKDVSQTSYAKFFDAVHVKVDAWLSWLFSEPVNAVPGRTEYIPVQVERTRYIDYHMRRYHYHEKNGAFLPVELEVAGTAADMLSRRSGLSSGVVAEREAEVGPNVISIAEPSFFRILIAEFTKIFYVYQNFMTWTWLNYAYWHMGIVNTCVYTLGGFTVSYVQFQSAARLKQLSRVSGTVHALRDGKFVEIDQSKVVPGDIISLQSGMTYCDMVLLSGEAIVDESSLTGESMPVVKTPVDPTNSVPYDALHQHKHHSIFAGTVVTNDSEGMAAGIDHSNLALVVRSGSHTLKGELLRDMLYEPPKKFKFDVEVNFVLLVLLCYAIFGFSMTIYFLESEPVYGFFYAIYVVASALPPLLPTVFIVSEGISADRLLKKRIAVSDSHRILMAGKVRVAFFDKTGTLTEQGLDFISVIVSVNGEHFGACSDPTGIMARAMSVCHSVKKINMNGTSTLIGNALDRKMFESTGFSLEMGKGDSPDVVVGDSGTRLAILRQFDFDSKRKTQTVIVRDDSVGGNGQMWAFTKGTGEAIKGMSDPSTVPDNLEAVLADSAKSGMYQISIGYREVDAGVLGLNRDAVECDMTFIGCINFSNRLKSETPDMLRQLREGDIRSVILSGDHVLTAIYIARLSGMVHKDSKLILGKSVLSNGEIEWVEGPNDARTSLPALETLRHSNTELAMSGVVWETLWAQDAVKATKLAHFIRVVGRCSPSTKISMVECFNKDGFITLMCGDGGNDCGALKTAHVGIALSDSEASVVSPFTSIDKSIISVLDVLKEGRCTLTSAISSYKYMIMYGQIETINQMICAWFSITFSEWCWVFMDGFWVISMAFSLPFSDVADRLAPSRPTSSILGPHTLASVLGLLLLNFLFVVIALAVLFEEDWFQCRKWEEGSVADVTAIGDNYEASVLFLVSGYQYIATGIAFNFGFQHRAGWLSNWRFVLCAIAWTVIHFTVILHPSSLSCFFRVNCVNEDVVRGATSSDLIPIQNEWNTTLMPLQFREKILVICIVNAIALSLWEYFVVNGVVGNYFRKYFPTPDRLVGGVGYGGATGLIADKSDGVEMMSPMMELHVK